MNKSINFQENYITLQDIFRIARDKYEKIATAPSMLSLNEENFLYLLAKEYFTGEGAIFDAGCHLGGCAQCFAKGLADSKQTPFKHIYSYELGIAFDAYVIDFIRHTTGQLLQVGDSFEPILKKNLTHCEGSEYIELFVGDIMQQKYPDKIEILFLDVCKSTEINQHMIQLFERCIPGKSVIVQQDYMWYGLPWLNITMGYFADYFELIPGDAINGTLIWLYKKEIPQDLLKRDLWKELSIGEKLEYMSLYNDKLCLHDRIVTELNKVALLLKSGHKKAAESQLHMVECLLQATPTNANLQQLTIAHSAFEAYNNAVLPEFKQRLERAAK